MRRNRWVLLALVFAPMSLVAADFSPESLKGYRMGACDSWRFNSGTMPGYSCSYLPSSVVVADAYTFADKLKALEARIAELEGQLAELKARAE